MPFVSPQQLASALELLRSHRPLPIFTIPALTQTGVTPKATQADAEAAAAKSKSDETLPRFRGREESAFLKQFFSVKGGPPGKPFYSPSNPDQATGQWVSDKYSGSTLQAQRRERRGRVFFQADDYFFPRGKDWKEFATHVRDPEHTVMATDSNGTPLLVPLFALASWLWRTEDFADTQALISRAIAELKIPPELIGTVYDDALPAGAAATALTATPLSDDDFAEIVGAVPPPPQLPGGFGDLVDLLMKSLTQQQIIASEELVTQLVRAWAARDIVILVGAGGTGKTTLAKGILNALESVIPDESGVEVPISADFDTSDLLGYENLANVFVDRDVTARILRSSSPLHPHVLLLEEINLAPVDSYLAPILHAVESGSAIPLTGHESVVLPNDTLVLATCNSPRDEPETRLAMSAPTKRRATVIEMPNLLYERWKQDGEQGISKVIDEILSRELSEIQGRAAVGRASWLDTTREARLQAVSKAQDLDADARTVLLKLVGGLLATDDGKRWMTFGPLRDLVVQMVWADSGAQAEALGTLVTGKILQQVQSADTAQLVADTSAELPAADTIQAAVDEMEGPGGSIRPLL